MSEKVIHYLDLSIVFPPSMHVHVGGWVERFEASHSYVEISPRFSTGTLLINSTDLVALSGYISEDELTPFEQKKIASLFTHAIEQTLLRSTSVIHRQHYKWCLAALKNLPFGRFL